MIAGTLILVLTIARLIVRLRTATPAPATTGNPLLDKVGRLTHVLLYLLVFGMAGSGIAMSIQADLPAAVFRLSASLPVSFEHLAPRKAHGLIAKALIALVVLHVAAALYHQLVRKDGLLRRMMWTKSN
jgi:cytochrome b561